MLIPFFPAKFQTTGRGNSTVWGLCVHTMETPRTVGRARQVAQWFASKFAKMQASTHYDIDAVEIYQNVLVENTAWATGDQTINQGSISYEISGSADQSPAQWSDVYSDHELSHVSALMAHECFTRGIPVRKLTPAQIRALAMRPQHSIKPSEGGLFGHLDVTLALGIYGGHRDPGQNFPWPRVLKMVAADVALLQSRVVTSSNL